MLHIYVSLSIGLFIRIHLCESKHRSVYTFTSIYKIKKGTCFFTYDQTRPVQYERGGYDSKTDIHCPMYIDYEESEKYCKSEMCIRDRNICIPMPRWSI